MLLFPKSQHNLFSIFFHAKEVAWHKWDYEIEKYDILGDKEVPAEVKQTDTNQVSDDEDSITHAGEMSPTAGGALMMDEEFQNKVEF